MPLLYSHFFKLHLCSRVISQIIQLSLPVFILSAEAAPPSEDAESLPAHRAADSDLWLLQRRANEKDKFPTSSNPSSRKLI